MNSTEQLAIKSITIKYFRSITSMTITAERLNILVGVNDVGKSNVLKALNLFFNNETDYNEKFSFEKDFSQLFPLNSKKAREIIIKISFMVPSGYKGYGEYIWEKRWRSQGLVKDDIIRGQGEDMSPRSRIPNLLRKIVFRYVPAVKSNDYYKFLLIELYKAVSSAVDSPLKIASNKFSQTLREYTTSLSDLILKHIDMESKLSLPRNFSDIFETLMFNTKKNDSDIMVPLEQRGDGIQARHIPIILKYIADEDYKQSNSRGAIKINTIWGFEEPENGLELLKAFEMASEFLEYAKDIQIFVTTHSPAFYEKRDKEGVKIIFIIKSSENDSTILFTNPERIFMDENMGLMPFVAPYIAEQNRKIRQIKFLWEEEPLIDKPTIMVEGKSDKSYLKMAIQELSEPLQKMLDNDEIRIVTKEKGAGTTLIRNWVMAWLYSRNSSKMLAIFDKDYAGDEVVKEIKENILYLKQNKKSNVRVIQLQPSESIIELYNMNLHIPFEIEHLLSIETWKEAISKNYVIPRSTKELSDAYKKDLPRDKAIDTILDEIIVNTNLRETIANFNPHKDKKINFCDMVERIYQQENTKDIFNGFKKTVSKIEQFFT